MRTISFIVAFAMLFLGPSIAGSADAGLPGIGTFDFGTSAPIAVETPFLIAAVR